VSGYFFLNTVYYKGRSINKLQNRVILLAFQISKILNMCFVGNLILNSNCEFYDGDVTVKSFTNTKCCDVATEILPRQTACRYCIFVGQKINANHIHSEVYPIYGDKCITKRTVHVWCKKKLGGQKFASYTDVQSVFL